MTNIKLSVILSLSLAGAVLFGSPLARAAHTGFSHADLCSSSGSNILFDDAGAVNNATVSAGFFCPVINADPNSMTAATGRVRGWDGDPGQGAFICRGVMRNYNSQTVWFTGDAQGPLTPGYTGVINLPHPGNGVMAFPLTVTFDDSLVIGCDVPPGSGIYNVRVDQ